VGPRASLDEVKKRTFLTLPGLELRPLGGPTHSSRYTDYAIPSHLYILVTKIMFKVTTRSSSIYKLVTIRYYIPIHIHISRTNGACKGLIMKANSFSILLFLHLTLDILGISGYCDVVSGNQTKAKERM
jgi:hypothetical protein